MPTQPPLFLSALHPLGAARHVLGIGGRAGAWTASTLKSDAKLAADVVVLAPSVAQCISRGWLAGATRLAFEALSTDGILHAVVPWFGRAYATRLLHQQGLETAPAISHFRMSGNTACHVPVQRQPLLYAFESLPIRRARLYRPLLRALLAFACGPKILAALLPATAISAFRAGGSPPFSWLLGARSGAVAVVASGWHSSSATLVFGFLPGATEPAVVAKTYELGAANKVNDEVARIADLGAAVLEAGASVPVVMGRRDLGSTASVVETVVSGRPVALLLRRHPRLLAPFIDELAGWLERWNRLTLTTARLSPARREAEILLPAEVLRDELSRGADYLDWIACSSRRFVGAMLPLAASHNDLTMSNVLRDSVGRLGVIDWDGAQPDGFPLVDFWYGACDAVSAVGGHADRALAFADCFVEGGRFRPMMMRCEARLRQAFGGADEWINLCFHAVWLQHAMNERQRGRSGASRPFLSIVQTLALRFDCRFRA